TWIQATGTGGIRARLRRVAGCAIPSGSAGHAGETANLKLTFHLDHSEGADQVHSHVDVAPVSSPIRETPGACDLINAAMVSGSDATTPSRSIFPVRSTMQIAVSFSETSSPT